MHRRGVGEMPIWHELVQVAPAIEDPDDPPVQLDLGVGVIGSAVMVRDGGDGTDYPEP